jgi:hypothetical protein
LTTPQLKNLTAIQPAGDTPQLFDVLGRVQSHKLRD